MAHRKTLNEKQLSVLLWIADGCPDGVMAGNAHRISAAALRARHLVKISGRGPTWTAEITADGRKYLERAAGPAAPIPRQANISVTRQLTDEVIQAGGSLRVPRRPSDDEPGVDYAKRAELAERHRKVPLGKRLAVRPISADELQIDLVNAPERALDLQPAAADAVPVPTRVARYHPVVHQFKHARERHEVSRATLPRALRILQALVIEAERRGYRTEIVKLEGERNGRKGWSGPNDGHLVILANGCPEAVRIKEEGLQSRAYWEQQNRSYSYLASGDWTSSLPPRRAYEVNATGRLTLELVSGYRRPGRSVSWGDRKSWTLEDKLPELLREIEIRAVEHEQRQREAERETVQRERAWQAAVERARIRHANENRIKTLQSSVQKWHDAERIRAYCQAAESAYPDVTATREWIAWARQRADELDPLSNAPQMPPTPETVSPEELRPYMDGWDPYGPSGRGWCR